METLEIGWNISLLTSVVGVGLPSDGFSKGNVKKNIKLSTRKHYECHNFPYVRQVKVSTDVNIATLNTLVPELKYQRA